METRNKGFYSKGYYIQTKVTNSVIHDVRNPKSELKEFQKSLEFYILRLLKRNSTKGSGKRVFSFMISNNLKNYFFNNFNILHKLTQKPNFNETYRLHDFKYTTI
jgi:hypothetical protein